MNYGDKIRSLRKQHKISTERLGQLINLSQSMVSKIENGERNLDIDVLECICSAFDISLAQFFTETKNEAAKLEKQLPAQQETEKSPKDIIRDQIIILTKWNLCNGNPNQDLVIVEQIRKNTETITILMEKLQEL